jgi:hypothetical protein
MYIVNIMMSSGEEKCFPAESVLVLGVRMEGKKRVFEEFKAGKDVEKLASKALRDCEGDEGK